MAPTTAEDALTTARRLLDTAQRIVVLTGAGISTESGIPDFRGPNGVWTKDPAAEKASHIDHWVGDPEVRRAGWQRRLHSGIDDIEPNAGHRALVELERRGTLDLLVTQNIDGLHHKAGTDPDRLVEIHGNTREVMCLSCGDRNPMVAALARVEAGDDDPRCRVCGGILKSATISFGQSLVAADLERAFRAAAACDLFVAIGTTLTVYPIAETVPTAIDAGADLVIVNAEPTPFDRYATAVLRDPIGTVLPRLVAAE